jgi:D-sedoheptulose 7-phosphate isomerase
MSRLSEHLQTLSAAALNTEKDTEFAAQYQRAEATIVEAVCAGHVLFIAGNGGSAGEVQHFSGEIAGRYKKHRRPWGAIALSTDSSIITCVGNDYSFDEIFSRQLEALGKEGDVLCVLSTSGSSPNILAAIRQAKKMNILTIGMGGKDGGAMKELVDIPLIVNSDDTPRIQEIHLTLIHAISEAVDDNTP